MDGFQLKIIIKGSKPPIWRRIVIPVKATFENLDVVIEEIFGWQHEHLWEFYLPEQDLRISLSEDFSDETPERTLRSLLSAETHLKYTYDFGDSWEHEIIIEKTVQNCAEYAQVIKSRGDYMIEDCGGVRGYYDVIEEAEHFDREAANEVLKQIPIGHFIMSVRSIGDVLLQYRKPELQQMAKAVGLQKYQNVNKPELAAAIGKHLLDADCMRSMMDVCSEETIRLFETAIEEGGIPCAEEEIHNSLFLCSYGAYAENEYYLVPKDVQELYQSVCSEEYRNQRRFQWLLMQYCRSAAYLYGVIPLCRLAGIYAGYEEEQITADVFERYLKKLERGKEYPMGIALRRELLMDEQLAEGGGFRELLLSQEDIAYYIPETKEEFLRYGHMQCQEPNDNTMFFLEYAIQDLKLDFEQACMLFFEAQELIRKNHPYEEILDYMEEMQMPAVGRKTMKELENQMERMARHVRHWQLRGFTLEEMYPVKAKVIPFRKGERV